MTEQPNRPNLLAGADNQKPALTPEQIARKASARASWHRKASKPVSVWMMVLFVSIFVHRWIPNSIWLMVHMVALGLITNSILIWSQHFTEALLKNRRPDEERGGQVKRVYALNAGIVVLMVGVVFGIYPLTILGSIAVGGIVAYHGLYLLKQLKQALPARFDATVRFYIAAAWLLPVGATFGAILANDSLSTDWHMRLLVAHESVNVLGFVGITVIGTLMTLWPTMLRTKMHPRALDFSKKALGLMCAGIAVTVTGALAGWRPVAVTGLGIYLVGVAIAAALMVKTCTKQKPIEYTTLSVAAGVAWLMVGVLVNTVMLATHDFGDLKLRATTPIFVAGFLLQVLLGAMSYLLPVGMGGGPAAVRAANKEFTRFSFGRIAIINLCLLFFALPASLTGSWVRATTSVLGALAFALFIPFMLRGVKKSIAARKEVIAARARGEAPVNRTPEDVAPAAPRARRELLIGSGAVLAAVAAGVAVNPSSTGLRRFLAAGNSAEGTGATTRVAVEANGNMRFVPASVEVPVGNRLIIDVKNVDQTNVHDLALATGVDTGRIDPGQTKTLDAGVITSDVDGWCTIIGHRAMGMTFKVVATGASGQSDTNQAGSDHSGHGAHQHSMSGPTMTSGDIDLAGETGSDFTPRNAVLAPLDKPDFGTLSTEGGRRVHRMTFNVAEHENEIAPGVRMKSWTYDGRYMGPVLHGSRGDLFEITLKNGGTMGHSIDFHAGMVSPDGNMRTIAPGEQLTYRFEARGSGIWLYHCSTMPMSSHVAAGMFGAVVIDPDSIAPVDHEWVLVQNETYLTDTGQQSKGAKLTEVSPEGVAAGVPTVTMFNGHATQYVKKPLEAKVGQRVRMWVLAAGPSKGISFHVVGSQFDTVYKEGGYLLREGRDAFGVTGGHAQSLDLASAQGGFVEMEFLEPGTYTFVNHSFAEAGRGARGLIKVTR